MYFSTLYLSKFQNVSSVLIGQWKRAHLFHIWRKTPRSQREPGISGETVETHQKNSYNSCNSSFYPYSPRGNPLENNLNLLEFICLASPDALEVIVVTHLILSHLLIVSTDLTDVTLVSDDTY